MENDVFETMQASAAADASRDYPIRIVTAASLFDGHDAAINIMRRIMQSKGAEVFILDITAVCTKSPKPHWKKMLMLWP